MSSIANHRTSHGLTAGRDPTATGSPLSARLGTPMLCYRLSDELLIYVAQHLSRARIAAAAVVCRSFAVACTRAGTISVSQSLHCQPSELGAVHWLQVARSFKSLRWPSHGYQGTSLQTPLNSGPVFWCDFVLDASRRLRVSAKLRTEKNDGRTICDPDGVLDDVAVGRDRGYSRC